MKKLPVILLLLGMLLPWAVQADQKDPRLEDLFEKLKMETSSIVAAGIEDQIWDIWIDNEDSQAKAMMLRGIQQMNSNAMSAALDTYTRLIAMKPDYAEAWNKRATIYYLIGEYDKSLADIDEVLKLEPYHFGAISGQGLVYMAKGDYLQARSSFLALLEVYPSMRGVKEEIQMLDEKLKANII